MAGAIQKTYSQVNFDISFSEPPRGDEEVEDLVLEAITGERTPAEQEYFFKSLIIRELTLSGATQTDDAEEHIQTQLARLFSANGKDESHMIIEGINARSKVKNTPAEPGNRAVPSAQRDVYEVTLAYKKGDTRHKAILVKSDARLRNNYLSEITIAGKTFQVLAKPVQTGQDNGLLLIFFEPDSPYCVYGMNETAAKTTKPWRARIPVYHEVARLKAVPDKALSGEFDKPAYKNLRKFNYKSWSVLAHTLIGDYLQTCQWRRVLKEDCELAALRLAVKKGSIETALEILEHIESMPPLDASNPQSVHMGGRNIMKFLRLYPGMIRDYNKKLKEIKSEAIKLKSALQAMRQGNKPS